MLAEVYPMVTLYITINGVVYHMAEYWIPDPSILGHERPFLLWMEVGQITSEDTSMSTVPLTTVKEGWDDPANRLARRFTPKNVRRDPRTLTKSSNYLQMSCVVGPESVDGLGIPRGKFHRWIESVHS